MLHLPLEWPHSLVGIYGAVNSAVHGVTLVLLLPVLMIAHFPDPLIGLVGVFFAGVASIAIANVKNTWEMFLGIAMAVFVKVQLLHPFSLTFNLSCLSSICPFLL